MGKGYPGGPTGHFDYWGVSRSIAVARFCPQGGVLSHLLWCLVVDELLTGLNQGGSTLKDMRMTLVFWRWKFPNTVPGFMQRVLISVEEWCDGYGLSVNPDKTRRKLPGFFEPQLFGKTLRL
jgi:hypothetical protein